MVDHSCVMGELLFSLPRSAVASVTVAMSLDITVERGEQLICIQVVLHLLNDPTEIVPGRTYPRAWGTVIVLVTIPVGNGHPLGLVDDGTRAQIPPRARSALRLLCEDDVDSVVQTLHGVSPLALAVSGAQHQQF